MISLLHNSGNRKQPTHAFSGAMQGMKMLFSIISMHVHISSFLAQHSQTVFHKVTSPLPVLMQLQGKRNRAGCTSPVHC